jgi:hypothetical protein
MSKKHTTNAPWSDIEAKKQAFIKFMDILAKNPKLVGDDIAAKKAFKAMKLDTPIDIPDDVRIIVLPDDESQLEGGRSMVIEAPPPDSNLNPNQKLERFLCTYPVGW